MRVPPVASETTTPERVESGLRGQLDAAREQLGVEHRTHRVTAARAVEPRRLAEVPHPGGHVRRLAAGTEGDPGGGVVVRLHRPRGGNEDVEHHVARDADQDRHADSSGCLECCP